MDAEERAKMEAMGYAVVDDAADWLELTEVERQIVDLRAQARPGDPSVPPRGPGCRRPELAPEEDRIVPIRASRRRRGRRQGSPST